MWRALSPCCLPGTYKRTDPSEDYCAATGVRRTRDRRGLLFPRSQLVTIAKAYQLQAIVRTGLLTHRIWYA